MRPLSVTLDAANMHPSGTGVWVWAVFGGGWVGKSIRLYWINPVDRIVAG
ncbi:hypothetical protein PQ469_21740 [Mucilaginibacter sp. KACC 22773]|nr:hypothetical protein [Mucilaginibacter sp. KACC 22773]WDF76518.1 hypothetical protein PQ469_21740 [Mucilaginibacter sp. KACC 22773]